MTFETSSVGLNTLKLEHCHTLGVMDNKLYIAFIFYKESRYDWFKKHLQDIVSPENLVLFIGDLIVFRQTYKSDVAVGSFCDITLEKTPTSSYISSKTYSLPDRVDYTVREEIRLKLRDIHNWYFTHSIQKTVGYATATVSSISLVSNIDKIRWNHKMPYMFNECVVDDYYRYIETHRFCALAPKIVFATKSENELDNLPKFPIFSDWLRHNTSKYIPDMGIKEIIFHEPATIVYWKDGTKTVVKCNPEDSFDPEKGVFVAMLKKIGESDYSGWLDQIKPYIEKYYEKK